MPINDLPRNTPGFSDGFTIGVGHMWLSWDEGAHIQTASILITAGIEADQARLAVFPVFGGPVRHQAPLFQHCVDPVAGQQ